MTFQLQSVSLHKSSAIVQNDRKYNIYRYIKITTKAPSYAAYASQLISPNLKNKLQWDEYVSGLERSKLLLLADNENSVWAAYSHLESHDRPINQREEWEWQKNKQKNNNVWAWRRCSVHTCNNIPISVLYAVLVLLGRVPGRWLSFKKTLQTEKREKRRAEMKHGVMWSPDLRTQSFSIQD